uniref:hypothetical protein n=1 Tax=Paractinoplanes polyasparticus TaxID=2856853 RepID=UPI00210370C9|nr:hypothetical protein [Actinoplanes polyasparticus]
MLHPKKPHLLLLGVDEQVINLADLVTVLFDDPAPPDVLARVASSWLLSLSRTKVPNFEAIKTLLFHATDPRRLAGCGFNSSLHSRHAVR